MALVVHVLYVVGHFWLGEHEGAPCIGCVVFPQECAPGLFMIGLHSPIMGANRTRITEDGQL